MMRMSKNNYVCVVISILLVFALQSSEGKSPLNPADEPETGQGNSCVARILDGPEHREWLEDMQVVLGLMGLTEESLVPYQRLVQEIDPDFNDWSPPVFIDPLLAYGVTSSESVGSFTKIVQGSPLEDQFKDAIGITATGKPVTHLTASAKKWVVCHNNQRWHDYKKQEILDMLHNVWGMNQDLILGIRPEQGFCSDCQHVFREFMKSRFSREEMEALGITDLAAFDMVRYLQNKHNGELGNTLVLDPLVRMYILAQMLSQRAQWKDIVDAIHAAGSRYGRGFVVTGNQHGMTYKYFISEAHDIVGSEADPWYRDYAYPRSKMLSLETKIFAASGRFQKPVWLRGGLFDRERQTKGAVEYSYSAGRHGYYRMRLYGQVFQDLTMAESFANGAVRAFNPANEGAPAPEPSYEHREPYFQRFIDYADMIHQHRPAFQDRTSAAEVAVIYSVPTHLWSWMPVLDILDKSYYLRMSGWAGTLEQMHVPYDVLMFGHRDIFPDGDMLERLPQYRLIILPDVICMTEKQAEAVRDFVQAGGSVVYSGGLATHTENREERPASLLKDFPRLMRQHIGQGRVVGIFDNDLDYAEAMEDRRQPNPTDFHAMKEAVMWALDDNPQVQSDISPDVQCNLWLAKNKRSASLHLVNYGVDLMRDYVQPLRNFTVTVRLPESLKTCDRLLYIRPGQSDMEITFKRQGNVVTFRLPELTVWGITVFTSGQEHETASLLVNARKQIRKHVITGDQDIRPWLKQYKKVETLYHQRRYDEALQQGRRLLSQVIPDWMIRNNPYPVQ